MRPHAIALWLLACSSAEDPPPPPDGPASRVDWVRGGDDQLTIGIVGPVGQLWLDGPDGQRTVEVSGSEVVASSLAVGTWTVRVAANDPGLTQRVGPRLERIAHVPLLAAADVKGDGDRLVVAGGAGEGAATATVFDVSDPTAPGVLWTLKDLGQCRDAVLDGRYLYLALECGCAGDPEAREAWDEVGLRIVDLEADGGPAVVGELGVPDIGGIHNITRSGDVLYLSDTFYDAVQVVDMSAPGAPLAVGSWSPTDGIVHDQTLHPHPDGDRLLAATWKGLGVLDLTDPWQPTSVWEAPLPVRAVHQAWPLDEEHVLLTSETAGGHLTVWRLPEAADTASVAIQVGEANPFPAGMIHNVAAHGDRAYAAWYRNGLVALDVTDPTQPWVIGVHATGDLGPEPVPADGVFVGAWGVWVDPRSPLQGPHFVAVSDSHAGLQLFHAWPEVVWYPRDDSNVRPTD